MNQERWQERDDIWSLCDYMFKKWSGVSCECSCVCHRETTMYGHKELKKQNTLADSISSMWLRRQQPGWHPAVRHTGMSSAENMLIMKHMFRWCAPQLGCSSFHHCLVEQKLLPAHVDVLMFVFDVVKKNKHFLSFIMQGFITWRFQTFFHFWSRALCCPGVVRSGAVHRVTVSSSH